MRKVAYLSEAVAQVLLEAREYARLSQAELAEKAECARSFISFVETQTHVPGLHAFVALAQTLEIPASELMRRVERKMEMMKENAQVSARKPKKKKGAKLGQ